MDDLVESVQHPGELSIVGRANLCNWVRLGTGHLAVVRDEVHAGLSASSCRFKRHLSLVCSLVRDG